MSELAEGARLEIVCAVTSGTEGSNPSLSAIDVFAPEHSPGGQVLMCAVVEELQPRPGETPGSYIYIRMFDRQLSASDPGKLFHVVPCFSKKISPPDL